MACIIWGFEVMTTLEMEILLIGFFNPRINIIVPNVCWGMGLHECDLLVLTQSNYAYEIEIKTSKSDLIADTKKNHRHQHSLIKYLYFAVPNKLLSCIDYIPKNAGIIEVDNKYGRGCKVMRKPQRNAGAKQWQEDERFDLARLGTMRILPLKNKILKLKEEAKK